MSDAVEGHSLTRRAALLLDVARGVLLALGREHPDPAIRAATDRAAARLVWAGSWLDVPYAPVAGPAYPAPDRAARELHRAADRFDELLEELEADDPVANANSVQTSCLAFAIVGATAAYLDRARAAVEAHAAR